MGILSNDTIVLNSAMVVYDAEPWLFSILTSKMHMAWVKVVGGRLKTDYRYSASVVYNNFPCPKLSDKKKEDEIRQASYDALFCVVSYPFLGYSKINVRLRNLMRVIAKRSKVLP